MGAKMVLKNEEVEKYWEKVANEVLINMKLEGSNLLVVDVTEDGHGVELDNRDVLMDIFAYYEWLTREDRRLGMLPSPLVYLPKEGDTGDSGDSKDEL